MKINFIFILAHNLKRDKSTSGTEPVVQCDVLDFCACSYETFVTPERKLD